jgi:hypothetical protein
MKKRIFIALVCLGTITRPAAAQIAIDRLHDVPSRNVHTALLTTGSCGGETRRV